MDNNTHNLIRDYAEGALSGSALSDFEQKVKQDSALKEELDLYLLLKSKENIRLKKQLLETAKNEALKPIRPSTARIRPIFWAAIAASVAIIAAVVWVEWPSEKGVGVSQLAQTHISTPYPPPVAVMGKSDSLSAALQMAYMAYRNKEYAAAANQLKPIADDANASDETLFYTGEALLQAGQWELSASYFQRVRPGYWREAADWRAALALIQVGQIDQAKLLLEKLRGGQRQKQVDDLLKAINAHQ